MRGVARDVGVSLATVQRHFPTKDELWRGAIDFYIESAAAPTLSVAEVSLEAALEFFLNYNADYPGLLTTVFSDHVSGYEERHRYIADRIADRRDEMFRFITDLQDQGVVRDVDTSALVLLMHMGVGSIASTPGATRRIYGFDLERAEERKRLAGALSDILRFGVGARDED